MPLRRLVLVVITVLGLLAGPSVGASASLAPPSTSGTAAATDATAVVDSDADTVADTYYRVLLRHTRWAQTRWDATAGRYRLTDFDFAVVLGNAVLLTRGEYDAEAAGISREELRSRTLATIRSFAATNRLAGGNEWGTRLFWDTTFQSYFVLAAHLLWDELDQVTRDDVDRIAAGQAEYATALGTRADPMSGSWTPNGLRGGHRGDTKLEEMGVYAQAIAPGLAWASGDDRAPAWRQAFTTWSRNEAGLPVADQANPTLVDGVPVSDNTAHNIHDTFAAENHGSYGPHYQSELWRTSGRNAIHFLMAGTELPEVLTAQPNGDELWDTILATMSDAGEPLMPMVEDREHLYGRDVIPLAFLSQVKGDRYAAWAEAALASRLEAYQAYAPADRITKFSGEPKYEPEARAEIAISYLLHEWRDRTSRPVEPVTTEEMFRRASRVRDHGTDVGLLAQQSQDAWAGTVTKPGFTKFAWQPLHDDWLFDISGSTRSLLPSADQAVQQRHAATYTSARDGFEATASLLELGSGRAGMTTLPTGSVVYATSGTAEDEGGLLVRNLTMPGVPGLDGDRTYAVAEGATIMDATDQESESAPAAPPGVARVDRVTFEPTSARYVRMQGVAGHPVYGYSLFELEARNGTDGENLARGRTATASSSDPARPANLVTDGSYATRWAVAPGQRTRGDSWVSVDLGAARTIDRVSLFWESAAGSEYRVQVSGDGSTWRDVATQVHPPTGVSRVDDLTFERREARYVRMQGTVGEPTYGYSLFELEARDGAGTTNLARGGSVSASSQDGAHPATRAVDGSYGTRWAVAREDRGRGDSWLAVDLGSATRLDRVRLFWESAAGRAYRVQTSMDGETWTDAASYGPQGVTSRGNWLNVDDRAGLVVRGSTNPITVHADTVTLSDGPAAGSAGMVVEGYPGLDAPATAALAGRAPVTSNRPGLVASDADGFLSLFNLSDDAVQNADLVVPQDPREVRLYRGEQVTSRGSSRYVVSQPAATSRVEPVRFVLGRRDGSPVPAGLRAEVLDGATLRVTAPGEGGPERLTVTQASTGTTRELTVPAGATRELRLTTGTAYPLDDLALDRQTFPTSPLPAGMPDPDLAVDGDACTSWTPGSDGTGSARADRMVVDLGAVAPVRAVEVAWAAGPVPRAELEVSDDGLTWAPAGALEQRGRWSNRDLDAQARYVALRLPAWATGDAGVATLRVAGGSSAGAVGSPGAACAGPR